MKVITVKYVEECLRRNCVVAPVTIPKLIRTFRDKPEEMQEALNLFAQGLLQNYHMIPGNGKLEF